MTARADAPLTSCCRGRTTGRVAGVRGVFGHEPIAGVDVDALFQRAIDRRNPAPTTGEKVAHIASEALNAGFLAIVASAGDEEIVAIDDAGIRALYERKLVLVRPDGHVAWRGDALPPDTLALIDRVRGALS